MVGFEGPAVDTLVEKPEVLTAGVIVGQVLVPLPEKLQSSLPGAVAFLWWPCV